MNGALRQLDGGGPRDAQAPAALPLLDADGPRVALDGRVAPRAPEAKRTSGGMRRALVVLPLTSAVFAVSAAWSPSDLPGFVLCPFRAVTGLPCPGCGMTRAFCSIGHGDIAAAFSYNALGPLVFAAALLVWAHALAVVLKLAGPRAALERLRPTERAAQVMLALTLAWWVVRLCAGL